MVTAGARRNEPQSPGKPRSEAIPPASLVWPAKPLASVA